MPQPPAPPELQPWPILMALPGLLHSHPQLRPVSQLLLLLVLLGDWDRAITATAAC
jgi:hypothetical protein